MSVCIHCPFAEAVSMKTRICCNNLRSEAIHFTTLPNKAQASRPYRSGLVLKSNHASLAFWFYQHDISVCSVPVASASDRPRCEPLFFRIIFPYVPYSQLAELNLLFYSRNNKTKCVGGPNPDSDNYCLHAYYKDALNSAPAFDALRKAFAAAALFLALTASRRTN